MPPEIINVLARSRRPTLKAEIADYLAGRLAGVGDEARSRAYREALQLVLGGEPLTVPVTLGVRPESPRRRPTFARRSA